MTKKPFIVGDRVRVYDRSKIYTGVVTAVSCCGEVMSVRTGNETESDIYHPRQLRRLKPKRKPREYWLNVNVNGHVVGVDHESGKCVMVGTTVVHVVEKFEKVKP